MCEPCEDSWKVGTLHPLADTGNLQGQGQLDMEIWSSRKRLGLNNQTPAVGPRVEVIMQERVWDEKKRPV